ncbi:hypothetical protein LINGRAHAP2_LOCUS7263 [Linum grandiflorum]
MRWYVDDDGLPQASLVSEEDVNRLFQYEEDSRRLEFSDNEDIEDVFDESLLPLKEEAFVSSQRSDLRPAIGKIIFSFDNQWFEKMNNRLSEKGSPLWAILLYNSVPPQLFDMNPRPQGIVIREPVEEEDYLEQSSPDTVLFKTPETVMLELGDQKTSIDEIMAEQCAIEADLLAQNLKEAADSLAQASNAVPEAYKIRNPQSAEEMITPTDSLQVNEPETKSKGRKRQGSTGRKLQAKNRTLIQRRWRQPALNGSQMTNEDLGLECPRFGECLDIRQSSYALAANSPIYPVPV